jgi:hypothetical protein
VDVLESMMGGRNRDDPIAAAGFRRREELLEIGHDILHLRRGGRDMLTNSYGLALLGSKFSGNDCDDASVGF